MEQNPPSGGEGREKPVLGAEDGVGVSQHSGIDRRRLLRTAAIGGVVGGAALLDGAAPAFAAGGATTFVLASASGVVGDNSTDNKTNLSNFMAACIAASGSGTTAVTGIRPAGVILTSEPFTFADGSSAAVGVHIMGLGQKATILRKTANTEYGLVNMSGTATGTDNHCSFCSLSDLTLDGNASSYTGVLLNMVYADNLIVERVSFESNNGSAIDMAELWDSHIDDIVCDSCGSSTAPAIYIRSSQATSGFGYSANTTNVLRLTNVRCESWTDGAIWIQGGNSSALAPNLIWISKVKCESVYATASAILIGAPADEGPGGELVHMDDIYVFYDSGNSGASSASAISITNLGVGGSLRNCHIGNGTSAPIAAGVYAWTAIGGNGALRLENISGAYQTTPSSGDHIQLAGGGPYDVSNCYDATSVTTDVASASGVVNLGRQPDTGWAAITAGSSVVSSAYSRLRGDTVLLKGYLTASGGSPVSGATLGTIAAGSRPPAAVHPVLTISSATTEVGTISTAGAISISGGLLNGDSLYLDSVTFSID